jgi:hypothetical protein
LANDPVSLLSSISIGMSVGDDSNVSFRETSSLAQMGDERTNKHVKITASIEIFLLKFAIFSPSLLHFTINILLD